MFIQKTLQHEIVHYYENRILLCEDAFIAVHNVLTDISCYSLPRFKVYDF